MPRLSAIAFLLILGQAELGRTEPPAPPRADPGVPSDFKLVIETYAAGKEPIARKELVVHQGRAFQFDPGPPLEVLIHDAATERLELLNLKTKVRSEVSFKRLDQFQDTLHQSLTAATAKREAEGGKDNQVAARMSRDLIDPHFSASYDAATHRLRLSNPTVEVKAQGKPEPDRARLASIRNCLTALARLHSARHPRDIPPFPMLATIEALMTEHRLRPTELVFVYRLAGPPQMRRWTFRMEPSLTPRELEAIARVEAVRELCRFTRFDRYGLVPKKK